MEANIKCYDYGKMDEADVITLEGGEVRYGQCGDSLQGPEVIQELRVEIVHECNGPFFRIFTGEDGWSMNDLEELNSLIKNALQRFNFEESKK